MLGERSASLSAAAETGRGSTSSAPGESGARASGASGHSGSTRAAAGTAPPPAARQASEKASARSASDTASAVRAAGETSSALRSAGEPAAQRAPSGQLQRVASGAFPALARQSQPSPRTTCGGLLNQLRAMVAKPVPVVVIAGACEGGAAYRITEGLADAAR